MRILLVDDSKLQRSAFQKILEKAGYTIIQAADGEEGLELARTTIPDLILLDMILPLMDGRTVLAALKAIPETSDIPVVALTSLSQKNETKLRCAGAAAFYQKPESGIEHGAQSLIGLVRQVLAENRHSRATGRPSA